MTIVVTHTTPADSSFSTEGAAAWNANHALSGVGTMAEQDANNVAITGGSINNTTIGNTTPNAATFTTLSTGALTATGQTDLGGTSTTKAVRVETQTSTGQYTLFSRFDAGNTQKITAAGTANMALQATGGGFISLRTADGSEEQARITRTASAVNYVQVTGAATTAAPVISSQGSDSNIALSFVSKGTARVNFFNNGAASSRQFAIGTSGVTTAVNFINVDGSATGNVLPMQAQGTDTNISMAFQSKGTGGISLSTGSTGTNLVNGTTVTAITRTAAGGGYTGIPSVVLSAPTTAGGVQATATTTIGINVATIANGGTGYSVNDVVTLVGGTFSTVASQFTVTSVSGGVVTGIAAAVGANYSVFPTQPAATTGGTGTGLTLTNLSGFVPASGFTITNAGSGYVEQPTVTFSGGGGSGAAAYATVGSGTTVRSLGGTLDFYTPNANIGLRVYDSGGGGTAYWRFAAGFAATATQIASSAGGNIATGGTGSLNLQTNNVTTQLAITHTASAVNYVQVTGGATGSPPAITVQGSDSNIRMNISSKGTESFDILTNNTGTRAARFTHTASAVNWVQMTGAAAGAAPSYAVAGNDTNIDLALTPKGTGLVRFGTYTAGAPTATGYISIKAADGTTYKVLVGT